MESKEIAPSEHAAGAAVAAVAARVRPNIKLIALLSLGHMVVDLNQGSLPAILPFIKSAHGLSYSAVGILVMVANVTSSVIQPLFGWLSDRRARRWLLPMAVTLAGLGLAFTGIATGYWMILCLLTMMGMGVAAYHPEGYKTAAGVAGDRKATALSWFSVGGNVGVALGPPAATALIAAVGLAGVMGMLPVTIGVAALLLIAAPMIASAAPPRSAAAPGGGQGRKTTRGMIVLVFVVAIRSWAQLGFVTFLPFYYIDHLKADPHFVGTVLFVFLGAGAVGTILGGPLADRWGARRFTIWGFLLAAPLGIVFLLLGDGIAAYVALGMLGGVLISTFVVTVVLAQSYLPGNTGLASGLIVGFAIGAGGLAVSLLGWIADSYGLLAALWISALMPLAGFAFSLFLPVPEPQAAE